MGGAWPSRARCVRVAIAPPGYKASRVERTPKVSDSAGIAVSIVWNFRDNTGLWGRNHHETYSVYSTNVPGDSIEHVYRDFAYVNTDSTRSSCKLDESNPTYQRREKKGETLRRRGLLIDIVNGP